jgi:hypothetical protein
MPPSEQLARRPLNVSEPGSKAILQFHLYDGTGLATDRADALARFLSAEIPGSAADVRPDFLLYRLERAPDRDEAVRSVAARLARARVRDPERHRPPGEPLPGELAFERRFLAPGRRKPAGMPYDGCQTMALCASLLPPDEDGMAHCHIVLTNQLVGSWDPEDRRFHARAALFGYPSLLSTTGLVVAPARPRDYYWGRSLGLRETDAEKAWQGRFLLDDDPRMPEVLKGYLLQAAFHHLFGDPFCPDPSCRLFNAHWQEELLHAQLRPQAALCDSHRLRLRADARTP